MNLLGYLQKVGRALMVPVATLPAAAILMGVGYWIDPVGWGGSNALAAFFIQSGSAIIDNPIMQDNLMIGGTIKRKSDNLTRVEMVNDDNTDFDEVRSYGLKQGKTMVLT